MSGKTLSEKIFDEIALEGLEGITLSTLWVYLADSIKLPCILDSLKDEIWQFIKRNSLKFQFFQLPADRPVFRVYKRFEMLDDEFGIPLAMDPNVHRHFKKNPVQDKGILGSCECYGERKEISAEEIKSMSLEDVQKSYGERFVIVASQDLRYNALFPQSVLIPKDIPLQLYCTLEAIGRSRWNGETTSGPVSLLNFCKDSTLVFYTKNKLTELGVIATQNYNELRKGRIVQTTLVTLPRFYIAYQSAMNFIIETSFNALKENPNNSLPLSELRALFPVVKKKALKKVMDTHEFRRIFNVTTIQKSAKSKKSDSASEEGKAGSIIVSLRDAKMLPTELFGERNNTEEPDETDDGDISSINKLAYVDMLIKDQVYNAIFRNGLRGLSQTEICVYVGIPALTTRQIVKSFLEKRIISVYLRDAGRQRIQMYVGSEFAANVSSYNLSMAEIKKLKCNDEPKLPPPTQQKYAETPEITATIEPFKYIVKMTRDLSNRQIARMAIVINALNEKCLVHINEINNLIAIKEKEQGYTDTACRKSLRRVLNNLKDNGKINIFEVILKLNNASNVRVHRFVTHPKIHIDHDVVEKEILNLKSAFYFKIEEQRLQQESMRQAALSKLNKKEKMIKKAGQKDVEQKFEPKREVFQKIPKFLVSRYVHEFLFYIVVELNEYAPSQEITEELVQHWKKTDPSLMVNDYMELLKKEDKGVKAYTSELSWRTFIPPLQKYPDKPPGWVYLLDAIDRMPLSIFMKIFSLENNLESKLEEYVLHPIRQHYLVNQLPVELNSLINRVYMQKVFLIVLKLMSHMGLIQVSDAINRKDKLMMWVFLNRNAVIVDTTPSEASYSKISPNRTYESTRYTFNKFEDVYNYWMSLQRICIYTKLGFRKNTERNKQRTKELTFVENVAFDQAPSKDIGYIPGDGLGAGGLSMDLFAHVFRNWSWVVPLQSKFKSGCSYSTRRIPMSTESKNKVLKLKKAARKKQNFPVTLVKRLIPSQSGSRVASNTATATKRLRANFRDAIDREALKNMRTLRVTWSAEEDKILKLARAVYVFLAPPVISLPLVSVSKVCRDVIRHTIGIRNKTIQACLRRYHFLVKNNRHLPETPLWINILQTNEQLVEKYGDDFILNLRSTYPERTEFCNALLMHFIEIMCYLFKHINNIEEASGPNFCIPDHISEFKRLYQIRLHNKNEDKPVVYENPKTDYDLKVSVVYALLHSQMCCVRDKTVYTLQAFEIFKHFSEDVLKTAYTKARNDGLAVVLKRKYMNTQLASSHVAGPSYLLSSKYRFKLTTLKIPYQIYEAVYNAFQNVFEAIYGAKDSISKNSQYYELKAPHIGQLLAISEGLAGNYWLTTVEFPVSMLTVDSEQPICSTDRILSHYHGILDNAPKIEYIKNFTNENVEKQIRVKFHSANLSYKIYYSPYDLISKLSNRHLHFFCALDHLQKSIELNFSKLQRHEEDTPLECPFNCIMKNSNYLDSIERIVHEKRGILSELQEIPTQKILNQVASGNSIKIQQTNLLTIVKMLDKAWQEKEESADRKDFGKKLIEMKEKKVVDWIKICHDILDISPDDDDVDRNDEYEPMLTKDDRMRDAFVLNLPTIRIEPSELLSSGEKVEVNHLKIPKLLIPIETSRETILEKVKRDSHWTYTEENLTTLRSEVESKFDDMERKHLEEVHDFIANKKYGASFKDLLCEFPYRDFLSRALEFLSEKFLIKKVGVEMHVYVHKIHLREWLVHTFHITRIDQENFKAKKRMLDDAVPSSSNKRHKGDNQDDEKLPERDESNAASEIGRDASEHLKERDTIVLRPRPWIRLNGSLNRRVLDRWLSSLLAECLARNGCYVSDLCLHFQNIFPADLYFLLEILCDIKCITLTEHADADEVDIFSVYTELKETSVKEVIAPNCTYVTVLWDASSRMTNFIGNKKYNIEFI